MASPMALRSSKTVLARALKLLAPDPDDRIGLILIFAACRARGKWFLRNVISIYHKISDMIRNCVDFSRAQELFVYNPTKHKHFPPMGK